MNLQRAVDVDDGDGLGQAFGEAEPVAPGTQPVLATGSPQSQRSTRRRRAQPGVRQDCGHVRIAHPVIELGGAVRGSGRYLPIDSPAQFVRTSRKVLQAEPPVARSRAAAFEIILAAAQYRRHGGSPTSFECTPLRCPLLCCRGMRHPARCGSRRALRRHYAARLSERGNRHHQERGDGHQPDDDRRKRRGGPHRSAARRACTAGSGGRVPV